MNPHTLIQSIMQIVGQIPQQRTVESRQLKWIAICWLRSVNTKLVIRSNRSRSRHSKVRVTVMVVVMPVKDPYVTGVTHYIQGVSEV